MMPTVAPVARSAAANGQVADEPQRDDVGLALGILDAAERVEDVLLTRHIRDE